MRRRLNWSGVALAAALVLGALSPVGLTPASAEDEPVEVTPISQPGMAVSFDQAGELRLWGDNSIGQLTMPAELDGVAFKQVLLPMDSVVALTATGRVVGWGANPVQLEKIPAVVQAAKVVQIAAGDQHALAVTEDGRVLAWGKTRAFDTPLNVPEGLTDVKQVATYALGAAALKNDGSVVAWGDGGTFNYGVKNVPEGLVATSIAASGAGCYLALTPEGVIESWGDACNVGGWTSGSPRVTTAVRPILKSLATNPFAAIGILPSGKMAFSTTMVNYSPPPAVFDTGEPVLIASGTGNYEMAFVDADRNIHYWNGQNPPGQVPAPIPGEIPADLNGRDITQMVIGNYSGNIDTIPTQVRGGVVIRKLLRAELPKVTGVPAVGSTLTGTPGTFSASPDDVAGQWLANGDPIEGAVTATLTVTSAMAGKAISYRSTASKTGQTTISSTSSSLTVPSAASVKVTAAVGAYGKASAVTVAVAGAAGNVALTIGGRPAGTKALSGGKAVFSIAGTTAPGRHALQATYAGSESFSPGSATGTLTIGKGRSGAVVLKVVKASPKKKGTATVTVATGAGLVKAAGTAQVVLKQGRVTKKVNLRVVNGKAVGRLPKLKKGTWTATVTYLGSTYYLPAKSRAIRFKSK
ncbi:Ig-like domain repeat protein [Nocardioides marmoriginsengisoli]|nr:Ig-like domain repeat protein [Nocardioides marmoriginsengisoli]